jgi:hypothetical protein
MSVYFYDSSKISLRSAHIPYLATTAKAQKARYRAHKSSSLNYASCCAVNIERLISPLIILLEKLDLVVEYRRVAWT